jgi:glyoxylase-like metal-dependent hydrolase (beta-lactamase superfamily II)
MTAHPDPSLPWPPALFSEPRRVTGQAVHLLAPNAGAWTTEGTNTWVIGMMGGAECLVLDPGSDSPAHQDAIIELARNEGWTIRHIVFTHDHEDHIGGTRELSNATGVPVSAFSTHGADVALRHGDILKVDDLSLRVMHTPGHSDDSITLVAEGAATVFTADTLLATRSTAILGSLSDYFHSLRQLREVVEAEAAIALPGHGPLCLTPSDSIDRVIEVRMKRVDEVAACVAGGANDLPTLTRLLYPRLSEDRILSAGLTVYSGLRYLAEPANRRPELEGSALDQMIADSDFRAFLQ